MRQWLVCFILLIFSSLNAEAPTLFQGRYRPFETVQRLQGFSDGEMQAVAAYPAWRPLKDLSEQKNFTLYSDEIFNELRQAWKVNDPEQVLELLEKGYAPLEGRSYQKQLRYPTQMQLKAEAFYYRLPLVQITVILYALAIMGLLTLPRIGFGVLSLAFGLHTAILLLRWYILERPPVSNMQETVIYVPWVAVLTSFIFRQPLVSTAAASIAAVLLTVLQLTYRQEGLENLQPVLNSQYWLIIHVLMIVASYGILILCGILGHFALFSQKWAAKFEPLILKTMYLGVALLIPGTILGGVWAAESWGRFWDWDPKESWAFISSCLYLLVIHAYRYHYIEAFGLAVGSILGLLAISFTWYGVNYILGTGLHSYGFGSGGEHYYYLFILSELVIISLAFLLKKRKFSAKI